MQEEIVKIISATIIYIAFFTMAIVIGYSIEDVDSTMYPPLAIALVIYVGIGDLALTIFNCDVPSSERIGLRKIDLLWGIRHYYWAMWWPRYIKNKLW